MVSQRVGPHSIVGQTARRDAPANRSLASPASDTARRENGMAEDSVYKVVTLVGTSSESWERATAAAIEEASRTLRDLRIARVLEQDVHIEAGQSLTYRVKLELSFKYEGGA